MNDQPNAPSHANLAARVFDTPLLIHEGKLQQILAVLGPRLNFDVAPASTELHLQRKTNVEEMVQQAAALANIRADYNSEGRYYQIGSTAVIPIIGTLVQRSGWMDAMSGMTSYAQIEHQFMHAMGNSTVDNIMLELDTPGGEVAGCFALADKIYAARQTKKIIAVASEYAASAGYLLASSATEVVLPATGSIGSIGVVAAHFDRSKEMEDKGVAVTFIFAGDKKVDGNPFEPLSTRARAEWQENINTLYGMFTETVARNRNLSQKDVRSTEAGMFMGRKAVDAGLADRVNTFGNEVHNIAINKGSTSRLIATQETTSMKTYNQEQLDAAVADAHAAGVESAKAESAEQTATAVSEATSNERTRITTILQSDEAKKRTQFATHLAFNTELSAAEALKMLAASPEQPTKSQLDAAMEAINGPEIPGQEVVTTQPQASKIDSQSIYANLNKGYNSSLRN